MGVIEDTIGRAYQSGRPYERALAEGINVALAYATNSGLMEEPDFTGEVDMALIHHLGEDAFDANDLAPAFGALRLARRITAEETDLVPVVLSYQVKRGAGDKGNIDTAMMVLENGIPQFRSRFTHGRDVSLNGHTSKVALTERRLWLMGGKVITVHGNLFDPDNFFGYHKADSEQLLLSQTRQIDPQNRVRPKRIRYEDTKVEVCRTDFTDLHAVVGWNALVNRLKGAISGSDVNVDYVAKARNFLSEVGALETVSQSNPRLGRVYEHAADFTHALSMIEAPILAAS